MAEEIKKKHGGGPKKIVIDLEVLEKLLIMQATDEEIGAWFGLTKQGISWRNKTDPEFHRVYANGKNRGKCSLRREMWKSAQGTAPELLMDKLGQPVWDSKGKPVFTPGREPNVGMQIFLAKNFLGMSDKQEVSGTGGQPISVKVVLERATEV